MQITIENVLPSGRPPIYLLKLLDRRDSPYASTNHCVCLSLADPTDATFTSLVSGLRKVLPFMYRTLQDALSIFVRYGMNLTSGMPFPMSPSFQWAHAGEILSCIYFEECEGRVVLTYKWRLNTTKNQNAFGMDLLAFDLAQVPPQILAVAVKTTDQGADGRVPSVVYDALRELKAYLSSDKLHDDLEIIAANLHTDDQHRQAFLDWYDPYAQNLPLAKPTLVAAPTFVAEAAHWSDKYAKPAADYDFGIPGIVRVICVRDLAELVRQVYC